MLADTLDFQRQLSFARLQKFSTDSVRTSYPNSRADVDFLKQREQDFLHGRVLSRFRAVVSVSFRTIESNCETLSKVPNFPTPHGNPAFGAARTIVIYLLDSPSKPRQSLILATEMTASPFVVNSGGMTGSATTSSTWGPRTVQQRAVLAASPVSMSSWKAKSI